MDKMCCFFMILCQNIIRLDKGLYFGQTEGNGMALCLGIKCLSLNLNWSPGLCLALSLRTNVFFKRPKKKK